LLTVPCGHPGIRVIHGGIAPIRLDVLADAIAYHGEGRCGDREH